MKGKVHIPSIWPETLIWLLRPELEWMRTVEFVPHHLHCRHVRKNEQNEQEEWNPVSVHIWAHLKISSFLRLCAGRRSRPERRAVEQNNNVNYLQQNNAGGIRDVSSAGSGCHVVKTNKKKGGVWRSSRAEPRCVPFCRLTSDRSAALETETGAAAGRSEQRRSSHSLP